MVSELVREIVAAEVERGQKRLDDWNARLVSHALAVRRGQLAQRAYAAEVERWRRRLRHELVGLHLKGAAAGLGIRARLRGEVLERVAAELHEPLARIDALARTWVEQPPEGANCSELARGETGRIDVLRSALTTFDLLRDIVPVTRSVVWEEWKHPRDEKGRFGHGSVGSESFLQPTFKTADQVLTEIVEEPFSPANHSSAQAARERILEIDNQYETKYNELRNRGNKIDDLLLDIREILPSYKEDPEFQRLRNEARLLDEQRYPLRKNLRREVWSQLAVQTPARFRQSNLNVIPSNKQEHINIGVKIANQFISSGLVIDKQLFFWSTEDSGSKYENGIIFLGKNSSVSIVAHEIAHHVERDSYILQRNLFDYRKDRVEEAKRLGTISEDAKLEQLTEYEGLVMGYRGVFFDNYISRYYPGSNYTEIFSMGLEYYVNDPLTLIKNDTLLFDYIYGILRGEHTKEK